jgi:phosphoribosyl 1,2-cyclic phosphodiesterase
MKIKFWGVRGSVPVPGESTKIYGGNTSCVSCETGGEFFIFDAGTGIRGCGDYLMKKGLPASAVIMISHTHWDHIQGFPFFIPSYIPGNKFKMYGPPSDVQNLSIRQVMELQTKYEYFPVHINQLGAEIEYIDCVDEHFSIGGVNISTCRLNHPVTCFAYKVSHGGKNFIYAGDHEPFRNLYRDSAEGAEMDEDFLAELDENTEEQNARIVEFCRGVDLAIWDAQYTAEEYQSKKGWGHSWYEVDLELAKKAGIKHLIMDHHDPLSADDILAEREKKYQALAAEAGFSLDFSREGLEINL